MRRNLIAALFFAIPSGTLAGAHHARPARATSAAIGVGDPDAWKGWLSAAFPDASPSWPKGAAEGLAGLFGDAKPDFIGKGDYHRDGKPTALLVYLRKLPSRKRWYVTRLAVVKWKDGSWREALKLDASGGVFANGDKLDAASSADPKRFAQFGVTLFSVVPGPSDQGDPGLWIEEVPVDANGKGMNDGVTFHYSPKDDFYSAE